MNSRTKYKTKQREILIDYLKSVSGGHITAGDVCEHFSKQGIEIGKSTIYRQLDSLVNEGIINKYIIDVNSPACFEYVNEESHSHEGECVHCKCEKCGRLIHLHCHEIEALMGHLASRHQFMLDPKRTVFYGLCEECR